MLFTIPIATFSNYYMKKICVLLRVDLNHITFDKIQKVHLEFVFMYKEFNIY